MGKLLVPGHVAEQQAQEAALQTPPLNHYIVRRNGREDIDVFAHMVGGDDKVVVFKAFTILDVGGQKAIDAITVRMLTDVYDVELVQTAQAMTSKVAN